MNYKQLFSSYLPLAFFIGMKSRERKILYWSLDSSPVTYSIIFSILQIKEPTSSLRDDWVTCRRSQSLISLITICFFLRVCHHLKRKTSLWFLENHKKNPAHSLMATELMQHIVYLAWILRPLLLGRDITSNIWFLQQLMSVVRADILLSVLTGEMSSPRATMLC